MGKAKYKRVTDLYVQGTEVELADGSVIWMQVLNPYERDEAVHDAQVARSRIVMALRKDGSERLKVEAKMVEAGVDAVIVEMAEVKAGAKVADIVAEIQSDPEWRERIEIMERTDVEQSSAPLSGEEAILLAQIHTEYLQEVLKREKDERDYQERRLRRASEDELRDEFVELWLEKRGSTLATAEYVLTEMWFGARVCESTKTEDGFSHDQCGGHAERVWDSKNEVRGLPEGLQELLRDAINTLAMDARTAKNSDRQGSSSDSSPLPSEPAESTPSTPTATHEGAPGTSLSQSATH